MPEGMPSLIKEASVSVIQDGKPLPGAKVALISSDSSVKWTVGGTTDEQGVAKLVTHGQYPGAPAGSYKVTVSKREEPQFKNQEPAPGQSDEEFMAARAAENVSAHQLVALKYGKSGTTDLSVAISKESPAASVDVGTSVRIPIQESK